MTTKVVSVPTTDISAGASRDRWLWALRRSDPATSIAALALTVALLRALKDRGVLAPSELDDVLGETGGRLVNDPAALRLLNELRAELERNDED
jgi:hypothetical protein